MTLNTTFQVVETPLNQQLEPILRIRKRDLPADPVHWRMILILGLVVVLVASLTRFALPDSIVSSASPEVEALAREGKLDNGNTGEALVSAISPIFSREVDYWQPAIQDWAREHGLDPDIVATIMQIESCGNPDALSPAGAQGLFQVMPFHFAEGEQMLDPETNARRGLSYFNQQLDETSGNIFLSFAGYNGGSAASSSGWDFWADETRRYYVWSKGIYEEAKSGVESSPTLQRWMEAGGNSLCQTAALRLGLD